MRNDFVIINALPASHFLRIRQSCSSYSHGRALSDPASETWRVTQESSQVMGKAKVRMIKRSITLEPALEELAGNLTPHQREMLAKKFFRWSKQLYVSVHILRRASEPPPRPALRPVPRRRLGLN